MTQLWERTTMTPSRNSWTLSSSLLMLFGAALVVMGLYFMLLRPAFLPEDLRFIGASQAALESAAPRLTSWLMYVFQVMGGFISTAGVLMIALAATSFRTHQRIAAVAAFIGGLGSIVWMTFINFMIDSDFKWVLLGLAIVWSCSLVLFWFESGCSKHRQPDHERGTP
jgi:hypothetical protein